MDELPVQHTGALGVRRQEPHNEGYLQLVVERKPGRTETVFSQKLLSSQCLNFIISAKYSQNQKFENTRKHFYPIFYCFFKVKCLHKHFYWGHFQDCNSLGFFIIVCLI